MVNVDDKTKKDLHIVFQSIIEKESIPGKGEGWVNIADFGAIIKEAGIDYRSLGFDYLGEFLVASGMFILWKDKERKMTYIKEKIKTNSSDKKGYKTKRAKIDLPQKYNSYTLELLNEWVLDEPVAVGYFQILPNGSYIISDFRSESFRELKYPILDNSQTDEEESIIITDNRPISNTYKSNKYFKFRWTTEESPDERGYKIVLATPIQLKNIKPQELIQTLHDIWNNPDAAEQMKKTMNMVSTELMSSSDGTFIYELLQNANDNAIEDIDGNMQPVHVEFHITDNYLICRHSGDYFSPRDIAGVCKLGDGSKRNRKNAIGYKGIGFKTVFHSHGWVYIQSDDYSFHFSETRNRPWQIMPIWESPNQLDSEIKNVIDKDRDKFRVVTVMKPRDISLLRDIKNKNYEYLLSDIFKDVRDIIFIPNIKSVKVFDNGVNIVTCQYDSSSSWIRSNLPPYNLSKIQEDINKEIILHPERGIPPKYNNFGDTTIAFACKCKDKLLIPVENATVNCYLPTKAEFGFPFLMNTDMVPTGARDQLKLDIEFNSQFAYIAGTKFVEWMVELIKDNYDASSVFDLIPDFEECKNGVGKYYSLFITKFEEGFYEKCKTEAIVPTISKDGTTCISRITDVLYDTTGITDRKMMSDSDFFTITEESSVLPIFGIRTNKNLQKLLNHIGSDHLFDQSKLVALCEKEKFQKWLMIQKNNNKWIDYIIETKQAKLFIDKKIFISGRSNKLVEAKNLIYDSKQLRKELSCFVTKYVDYLSDESYNYLNAEESKRSKSLHEFGYKWKAFHPYSFVETILKNEDDLALLKELSNSIGFYHMMARTYDNSFQGNKSNICKKIPLIVDGTVIDSIEGNIVYFNNLEGINYKSKPWIGDSWLYFLPDKYIEYDKEIMEPFFKHFVKCFTETSLIADILLAKNHVDSINNNLAVKFEDNLDFFKLMYKNRMNDCIKDGILHSFYLHANDGAGNSVYVIPKDTIVYNKTKVFEEFSKRPWVEGTWLYALDDLYFTGIDKAEIDKGTDSEEKRKSILDFFEKKCKVRLCQKAKLCTEIAMPHLVDILIAINNPKEEELNTISETQINKIKESNIDFFKYLSENYTTVFDGTTNFFIKKSFPFIDYEGDLTDGPLFVKRFYSISEEVKEISNATWLPQGFVKVISPNYERQFEDKQIYKSLIKKLGVSDFDYNSLLTDVVLPNQATISKGLQDFEKNKAFHLFFKKYIDKITLENIKKIEFFPVFLVGKEAPILSLSSKGHYIANDNLIALMREEFLSDSSVNSIHRDYFAEQNQEKDKKYWEEALGNIAIDNQTIVTLITDTQLISIRNIVSKSNEDNVKFWRLINSLKDIKKSKLTDLKKLPILMRIGSKLDSNYSLHTLSEGEECYMSDSYFADSGAIEYLVNEYAKDAWLLSSEYIDGLSLEETKEWFSFWEKVGILSSNEDIILHTIIPHLDKNVNEKIPILLFNNKSLIEGKMDDKMKEDFKHLHLCTNSGLKIISDVVFVKNDKESPFEEPLPSFPLVNQISSSYTEEQVDFFQSLTNLNLHIIRNQEEWFLPKIGQYITIQEMAFNESSEDDLKDNSYKVMDAIHYDFIVNLAKYRLSYILSLGSLTQDTVLQKIRLKRAYDNTYVKAQTLTLGSIYKPYCDFQSNGIPQLDHSTIESNDEKSKVIGLDYISEQYAQINDIISLLNYLGVHHKFIRNDVGLLINHSFCVYFWINYILNIDRWKEINAFIDEGIFTNVPCVPTKSGVKKPSELYSRDLINYVKRLSGGEELIPMDIKKEIQGPDGITYPHPLYKFAFLTKLSIGHCYEFLLNSQNIENKKNVLKFLLEYKDAGQLDKQEVEKYRRPDSNAMWLNGQNKLTHITKLYAIGKDNEDVLYGIYLGSDRLVISYSNIPDTRYEEICSDILGMKVLHAKDGVFEIIPTTPKLEETSRIVQELKQKSFLLATILCDNQNWVELYDKYKENIERLRFVKCQSISIEYKDDKRLRGDDVATVHYDSTTSTFYYVNDWQDKFVFDQLLNFLIKEIGIESTQMLMIKRILDTNRRGTGIDEYIEKFCKKYYTDDVFIRTLAECYPNTASNLHLDQALHLEDTDGFISTSPEYDSKMRVEHRNESEVEETERQTPIDGTANIKKKNKDVTFGSNGDNVNSDKGNPEQERIELINPEDVVEESEIEEDYCDRDMETPSQESDETEQVFIYDPDDGETIGSINNDPDFEPLGQKPHRPHTRRIVKHFSKEENERMRSHGTPLELESLPPTSEEIDVLGRCGIKPELISDTNYLAQLRLYRKLIDYYHEEPEESLEDFIHNADDVTTHIMKSGKYIHACSAAKGVMYISPSVWNKMLDEKWAIMVYLDGRGKNFHLINTTEEFLQLVKKDDVVIKITGKEKVEVVKRLYSGLLKDVKGTAYTLIRVASRTNMDAVFAHYVGAMAESEDGNDNNEYI